MPYRIMNKNFLKKQLSRGALAVIAGVIWIIVIISSLAWNRYQIGESFMRVARSEAYNSIQKDMVYRRWATMHEGVYVSPSKNSPPNPYLAHIPDRDVITTEGKELTLVNPAYMTRQVQELGRVQYGVQGYLVSLNPLRPENTPDPWEKQALKAFEEGTSEVSTEALIDGQPHYRLMRPFVAEEGCLRCHGHQGYKEGDILGGIGVSVPLASYHRAAAEQKKLLLWVHLGFGILGMLGLLMGNAHLRRSERALMESEKRFRIMADGSPFPIWVHDGDDHTAFVNKAFCEYFGTSLKEVKQSGWRKLVHPEDEPAFAEAFLSAMQGGKSFSASARVRRHDGQWRWIKSHAVPRFSPSGGLIGMVGSNSDITDHVRAEAKIAQKNEQLQKALAERDKFFAIIGHDLRSPLIGFLTFLKMLNEKFKKISLGEIQRLCREMQKSAENLYNLLENLLKWSLLQRGESDYNPVVCKVSDIVEKNIELMYNVAVHKDIKFKCQVPGDLKVFADQPMLETILRNLLTNAVKFSHPGGCVEVSASRKESMVLISVKDEGIGMDPELLTRLFKLDRISSRRGTASEKGTGLGLLLCREFVLKHGGDIWVESTKGQGSTFYFTLPADRRD